MDKEFAYPTKAELLALIAQSTFDSFTEADWYAFAGCETKNPLISQNEEYSIVIDGCNINMVYHEDMYGGAAYSLQEGY